MISQFPFLRPLAAIAVAAAILGGVKLYFVAWEGEKQAVAVERPASGVFAIEITLTFEAGPDPFSLEASDAPSLLVKLGTREILRRTDTISAGEPILVEPVEGLVEGSNEFYVVASPAEGDAFVSHAVRVRVLRDGDQVAEASLWSDPGQPVEGPVRVELPRTAGTAEEDSAHAVSQEGGDA